MNLLACDPIVGRPWTPPEGYTGDVADLLSEMDRLGIARAVVRHRACLQAGPYVGNEVLAEEIAGHDRLTPAWFLTPDGREPQFDVGAVVEEMAGKGVRLAWTDPKAEGFSILPWCSGPMYEALQARRIPLLLGYPDNSADDLDRVLSGFPELRVILLGASRVGRNRMVYPLLARHANLYLCLGKTYSVHLGVEDLCRTFGHERFLFGMWFPESESGAPLTGLSYARIPDEARAAIACGNIERLLSEVKL